MQLVWLLSASFVEQLLQRQYSTWFLVPGCLVIYNIDLIITKINFGSVCNLYSFTILPLNIKKLWLFVSIFFHYFHAGGVCDWIWTWTGQFHWSTSGSKKCSITSLYIVCWVRYTQYFIMSIYQQDITFW